MSPATKKVWKFILQLVAAAISAAITALGTTSCMKYTGII